MPLFSRSADLYEPSQDQYASQPIVIVMPPHEPSGPPYEYTGLGPHIYIGATPDYMRNNTVGPQGLAPTLQTSSWRHSHLSTPLEAMLEDLTGYITKDEEHPAARGGFGEIWKCTYRRDQGVMKVAVKSLILYSSDQVDTMEKKNKRIRRELKACARLRHRHILPICGYTFGFGPWMAIVSPWAENGSLTAYLERSGAELTLIRRFWILRDITDGLKYLHANNVIHADLNGHNVLIYDDDTACIADFGLALMYSELVSISQASFTSTLQGNSRWMAPELFEEREDGSLVRPNKQSDIYSFGGIMLQVLSSKFPYYHILRDAAVVRCIITLQKPSRSHYPAISDKHWRFIDKCWSADPKKRPSTNRVFDVIKDELDILSSSSRGISLHNPPPLTMSQGSGSGGHANSVTASENYARVTRWLRGL